MEFFCITSFDHSSITASVCVLEVWTLAVIARLHKLLKRFLQDCEKLRTSYDSAALAATCMTLSVSQSCGGILP